MPPSSVGVHQEGVLTPVTTRSSSSTSSSSSTPLHQIHMHTCPHLPGWRLRTSLAVLSQIFATTTLDTEGRVCEKNVCVIEGGVEVVGWGFGVVYRQFERSPTWDSIPNTRTSETSRELASKQRRALETKESLSLSSPSDKQDSYRPDPRLLCTYNPIPYCSIL